MRLGRPQNRSGRCGEETNLAVPGIEPGPSSPSLSRLPSQTKSIVKFRFSHFREYARSLVIRFWFKTCKRYGNIFLSDKHLASYARDAHRNAKWVFMWSVRYRCPILTETGMCRQIWLRADNAKFRENPFEFELLHTDTDIATQFATKRESTWGVTHTYIFRITAVAPHGDKSCK
jgi:hypothetical protein